MSILIVDYNMNNLASIRRSLEECGAEEITVSDDPRAAKQASKIILPGIGSFADAMKNLRMHGWVSALYDRVIGDNVPLLGICLGMQLLAEWGDEGGETQGLGMIKGYVQKLDSSKTGDRVPHVGWNEVHQERHNTLFKDVPNGSDFYFVHSYHVVPKSSHDSISVTRYCGQFVSAVNHGSVFGVQFHPEKSMPVGFKILKNFLNMETSYAQSSYHSNVIVEER